MNDSYLSNVDTGDIRVGDFVSDGLEYGTVTGEGSLGTSKNPVPAWTLRPFFVGGPRIMPKDNVTTAARVVR